MQPIEVMSSLLDLSGGKVLQLKEWTGDSHLGLELQQPEQEAGKCWA